MIDSEEVFVEHREVEAHLPPEEEAPVFTQVEQAEDLKTLHPGSIIKAMRDHLIAPTQITLTCALQLIKPKQAL